MLKKIVLALAALVVIAALSGYLWLADRAERALADDFFEDAIVAFEETDHRTPPPEGPVVFAGSSSIRFWSSLQEDMGDLPVLNRGFGGAHMNHLVYNAERIITAYAPRAVVVYAGDNDLAEGTGKTAEDVLADARALIGRVHARVPEARIHFLAIKPSKLRWARWPEMKRANALLEAEASTDPRLGYIDTASVLLDPEGAPRDDVFIVDGLHMNARGYEAWTRVIRPIVERELR